MYATRQGLISVCLGSVLGECILKRGSLLQGLIGVKVNQAELSFINGCDCAYKGLLYW